MPEMRSTLRESSLVKRATPPLSERNKQQLHYVLLPEGLRPSRPHGLRLTLAPPTLEFGKPDAGVRLLACREGERLLGTSQKLSETRASYRIRCRRQARNIVCDSYLSEARARTGWRSRRPKTNGRSASPGI